MERKIKEFKKFVTKQLENLVEYGEFDISVYVDDITDEAVELFAKQSSNKVRYPREDAQAEYEWNLMQEVIERLQNAYRYDEAGNCDGFPR